MGSYSRSGAKSEGTLSGISESDFNSKYRKVDRDPVEQEKMERDLLGDLATIVKEGGFTVVVVAGYTPTFNDGDVCTHSQMDPYLDGFNSYMEVFDRDEDYDGEEDEDGDPKGAPKYGTAAYERESNRRREVSNRIDRMQHKFQEVLETNWYVKLTVDGDSYTAKIGEYNPEY